MTGLLLLVSALAHAQTFGRVVAIGGHASDVALDENRRVAYVANFTANRIDVVSIDTAEVERSISVSAQPSSLSLSPDLRYLVVAHYAPFVSPGTPRNGLTVLDLDTGGRQSIALADPPYGVSFGVDGRALVVTSTQFIVFDPVVGSLKVVDTIAGVTARTLPQPPATLPTEIVGASVQASGNGSWIYGLTDTILFTYDVVNERVYSGGYVAEPPLGPRAVSVSKQGEIYLAGWAMFDQRGLLAQFRNPSGNLNVGGHAIDSDRGLIYAQIPEKPANTTGSGSQGGSTGTSSAPPPPPVLMVTDADNMNVRERLYLAENLAGKAVLSADGNLMVAISESGLLLLPVGELASTPRISVSKEDLVFRSNYCNPGTVTQEFEITEASGGRIPFTISSSQSGVRLNVSSATTPATVRVSVDPAAFRNQKGTVSAKITVSSARAVNLPREVRLLINVPEPDQRGTAVNVPGKLVDLLADPARNRFFVLRQDRNEVLVFDGGTYDLITRLRTGNTPTSMAITFDRRWLLVGNDNSQYANVFDLETLEPSTPVRFPFGHYPRWIAASARAILAATRVAGPVHKIDQVDIWSRTATELPTLGVFENKIDVNTALVASGNGSSILAAQADGTMLLYNASVDSFTISRKFQKEEVAGAIAASNFDQFVVGNKLMNASLVTASQFDNTVGQSSGFVFVDQLGLRSGAASAGDPGVIQRVELNQGVGMRSTRMLESPLLGTEDAKFTRTLAVMANRQAIVNLTVSGFTVLPWNYDASVAIPRITRVVNAADRTRAVAPGALISVQGTNLSAVNVASKEKPLPLALGESCLTVNGLPVPMIMVSPEQINAQLPFTVDGNVAMILRTPGGVSDTHNLRILPTAPSVFHTPVMEGVEVPMVIRSNGQPATMANPIRRGEEITIYLTGMGRTDPEVPAGYPAPSPDIGVLTEPDVTIGGAGLDVYYARLAPGEVGVYEIKCKVPGGVPKGLEQVLRITQGGYSTTVNVRVID
jgi:uncharacterized protein (TIGR03437 family)